MAFGTATAYFAAIEQVNWAAGLRAPHWHLMRVEQVGQQVGVELLVVLVVGAAARVEGPGDVSYVAVDMPQEEAGEYQDREAWEAGDHRSNCPVVGQLASAASEGEEVGQLREERQPRQVSELPAATKVIISLGEWHTERRNLLLAPSWLVQVGLSLAAKRYTCVSLDRSEIENLQ